MNKDLLNSLPDDDRPTASKLNSLVEDMQPSQDFQSELETNLIATARKKLPASTGWQSRLLPALAWTVLAIGAVLALNWTIRSLAAPPAAAAQTPDQPLSFDSSVRQGNICTGRLAAGHGFAVSISNDDKTGFLPLDENRTIGEMRSFAWSPDGSRLAIFGNTTGQGNVYLTDPSATTPQPILSNSGLGYLMDGTWSRDGKQIVMWSSQYNQVLYLLNTDGTGLLEKQINFQILGTPKFAPDGKSVVFYGADKNEASLFEFSLDSSQPEMINPFVEDESGFAFSPDGSRIAYIEYDRDAGEIRIVSEDLATGARTILGTFPIPTNPGSSLPKADNLSWSPDGTSLVFDFGRYETDRAIYRAPTNGSGPVKIADSAYAPTISADGKCLAYISGRQVFLLDLINSSSAAPLLVADLPAGRGTPSFTQDKLQWQP